MEHRAVAAQKQDPTVDDVFALLELLLGQSKIRLDPKARPVIFLVNGERWRFDPKAPRSLFEKQRRSEPGVLELKCKPELLIRLIKSPAFTLSDDDDVSFEGDLEDLLPIASALEQGASVLNVRSKR